MTANVNLVMAKAPRRSDAGVVLFSTVRNEAYFLPHFLRHYRALGVHEFWFLDDHSTDSTADIIKRQDDCGLFRADFRFGDMLGKLRFGIAARSLIPRKCFTDRWVLTVDADEFLLLPSPYPDIGALAAALDANGVRESRALMLDFYPHKLSDLDGAPVDADPFQLCRYFDNYEKLDWPDQRSLPLSWSVSDGVRSRMRRKLEEISQDMRDLMPGYKYAMINKVPLVRWTPGTSMLSAHHINRPVSDKVQLVLAHFKFYPGYQGRIADALATGAYWNASIEYRFLDLAERQLRDWPLAGARTRHYVSRQDMEASGLLYSHLPGSAGGKGGSHRPAATKAKVQ